LSRGYFRDDFRPAARYGGMHWSDRAKARMEAIGLSAVELSKLADVPYDQVLKQLQGHVDNPRGDTMKRLASALQMTEKELRFGAGEGVDVLPIEDGRVRLPIRFRVAAGNWMEVDDVVDMPFGFQDALPLRGVPISDQWFEEVVGDSFNMRWPEGTLLHVRAAWAIDPYKMHGRRVIVQRKRAQGALIERTVKEIVVTTGGKIELWPRSYNPKWSKPLQFRDGLKDGDEVEIAGLVEFAVIREVPG
jgi:hypothetical protein